MIGTRRVWRKEPPFMSQIKIGEHFTVKRFRDGPYCIETDSHYRELADLYEIEFFSKPVE